MKFGFRTPSLKKSIKSRTTGRIKRIAKKATNPLYGKKRYRHFKKSRESLV